MKVSIVIPCHNGAEFLDECLRSVREQSRRPDEIVVVDDGSTDGSAEIARRAGSEIQVLSTRCGGASAARAHGMDVATGDAIMFLDADDVLGPSALQALTTALRREPDGIARCPWFRLEREDSVWVTSPPSCADRAPWQDDLSAWLTGWYHPPCSLLWSRAALDASGGWDPAVRVNNDGDIVMRALVAGVPMVATEDGAGYYRRLPDGKVSLSGRRFGERGLRSRLFVLDRVSEQLQRHGRLGRYRLSLATAFDGLARDAGSAFPELSIQAEGRARALDGLAAARKPMGTFRRRSGQFGRLKRRMGPAGDLQLRVPQRDSDAPSVMKPIGDRPLVTVVIPTYNRAALLKRAIASVRAQTYENIEILVVDDSSTDGTGDVLNAIDDPRLRSIFQPQNGGVGHARNRGIAEARGELIAFLDSDDEWLPEKLEAQVDAFRRGSPRLGLVFTGVETVRDGYSVDFRQQAPRGLLLREMLLGNLIHSGSSAMIRRAVATTVGGFDKGLPAIEDYDFFLRIARFYEIEGLPTVLVRYHDDTPATPTSTERRSLRFDANMQARRTLYRRNRHDLRHLGIEHLYLLDSAIRQFRAPEGTWSGALGSAAAAVAARPVRLRSWSWLLATLPPRRVQRLLRSGYRRLKPVLHVPPAENVALGRELGKESRAK